MVMQIIGLIMAGPTNAIPPMQNDLSERMQLGVMAGGLLIMGLSSAALQTLGNIESVVRA